VKAVLDCNVFLSALIRPGGPPALILASMLRQEFELVLSPAIFAEYQRTINYPRIRKRILLSAQELRELEDDILVLAIWVEPIAPPRPLVVADPSDDVYLLAAAESEADYVVSGDHHLLALRKYEGIPIIPPRVFLAARAQSSP
jgi:putative PIN family toxin of toxin-antitoxin system